MASKTKTKQKSSKIKTKSKLKKLQRDDDSIDQMDLEDSGVHCEEPVGWLLTVCGGADGGADGAAPMQTVSSASQLSSSFLAQCSTRVTKSESPRIDVCPPHYVPDPPEDMTRAAAVVVVAPVEGDAQPPPCAKFSLYASDESDHETWPAAVSAAQKTARERGRERSKARFKRMLRPLRRSHSAGCNKDVPAHALFLRHQDSDRCKTTKSDLSRRSIDGGLSSMDRPSSGSDTDEQKDASKKSSVGGSLKVKKRSLAKDVKEKLAFLRRRHTETTLRGDDSKSSVDSALGWSHSFDSLLNDKNGLELFRDFLRTEFSEENIEFWIACEQFKNLHSNKIQNEAQKIYADYVAVQAPHEINLDSKTRMVTLKGLSNVTRQSFTVAQKRIEALMEKDSYRRFLQSSPYLELLGSHRSRLNAT